MNKIYDHKKYEAEIYSLWENSGAFQPTSHGSPFTIIMPPPNANASLHAGHAMYTVDDILVRYKRMRGYSAVWIPGMDHAGFETQYVYEKHLAKKGKSRMDFDRETLHKNIAEFVKENSGLIYKQMRRLGFSADWERSVYTASPKAIEYVYKTFQKMEKDNLIYRDNYIVNYCTHCGTSLAELEVKHKNRIDPLYFIKYELAEKKGKYITVATVRPETIFADMAIAVNPKDKRYKNLVGLTAKIPLINRKIPIISDNLVDKEFGTGALKITPAHDPTDFEIGKKHKLKTVSIITLQGKINSGISWLDGKNVKDAREETVKKLEKQGYLSKVDNRYQHAVTVCYKCGHDLEPTIIPNWFIKVAHLKEKVKEAVQQDKIKFYPQKYKKHLLAWLKIMHDWPISRQTAWAIRIPAWYSIDDNPDIEISFLDKNKKIISGKVKKLISKHNFQEIESGLQTLSAPITAKYKISINKPGEKYLQETDTFDTWFSSSQWPMLVLKKEELKSRLPTDVIGTLSDILKFWISRMILFSIYLENKIPFKDVYLWSMVTDAKGVKMSKSRGNVINPIELVDKYGADALRISLLYGVPAGSKVALSEEKVRGMRNFANKIWNAARFVITNQNPEPEIRNAKYISKLKTIVKKTTSYLEKYQLNQAAELLYSEFWHWYCDKCIEDSKQGKISSGDLKFGLEIFLKLLHPFIPFVTETVWQEMGNKTLLITADWPKEI